MDSRPPDAGTPRWVKVFGIVVVLLLVFVVLFGGGAHGPGRHASSGDAGGLAPASGTAAGGQPLP